MKFEKEESFKVVHLTLNKVEAAEIVQTGERGQLRIFNDDK